MRIPNRRPVLAAARGQGEARLRPGEDCRRRCAHFVVVHQAFSHAPRLFGGLGVDEPERRWKIHLNQ